jgi:hypothetical protein
MLSGRGAKTAIIRFGNGFEGPVPLEAKVSTHAGNEQIPILRSCARSFSVVDNLEIVNASITQLDDVDWRNYLETEIPAFHARDIIILDLEECNEPIISAVTADPVPLIMVVSPEQVGNGETFKVAKILKRAQVGQEVLVILNGVHYQELTDLICARLSFDLSLLDSPKMKLIGCLPSTSIEETDNHFSKLDYLYSEALEELTEKVRHIVGQTEESRALEAVFQGLRKAMTNPKRCWEDSKDDYDIQIDDVRHYFHDRF